MSETKIVRFVNMAACERIFSDYSTFVLRSPVYYSSLDETDRGDKEESSVKVAGGGSATTSPKFLISCWTMLDGDEPTQDEWDIFEEKKGNVVAIVSTPNRVRAFLETAFEINKERINKEEQRFPFRPVDHKHKPVTYAEEVPGITPNNIWDRVVFTKRPKFDKQKEYRFALRYCGAHLIYSYIFATRPDDYMERCFANPKMCEKDKSKLRLILLTARAGYGHFQGKAMSAIIAKADIVL